MCSRYELGAPPEDIIERFGLAPPSHAFFDQPTESEIRPIDSASIIGTDKTADVLP